MYKAATMWNTFSALDALVERCPEIGPRPLTKPSLAEISEAAEINPLETVNSVN